ncbi:TerB family tellurite resistance protein [Candidatus Pelagibacter sp.]|nr:TerB family tellurite resistance protein [Candidatus Pelagibacter sp.]
MFFKKKKGDTETSDIARVAALLIHAAKIDENFSKEEEIIISKALLKIGADQDNLENILKEGKEIEENSNQILDFTREVKNMDDKKKIEIIETLWRIIYSNKEADMFETNLMRRLAGLLYIDNKIMGDIKEKIKRENQ